jgi:hypothetical protein
MSLNGSSAHVPLTPGGDIISHKMGEIAEECIEKRRSSGERGDVYNLLKKLKRIEVVVG